MDLWTKNLEIIVTIRESHTLVAKITVEVWVTTVIGTTEVVNRTVLVEIKTNPGKESVIKS